MKRGTKRSSASAARAAVSHDRWISVALCVSLALVVWAVFGQTLWHEFVNYDDDAYVYENPMVVNGLTGMGLAAAFTQTDIHLWTPLTRISHMLVCQLFGLQPWAHHLANVFLHTATAILLFLAFRQMTGAMWRSAFVAAVFAIHPLHVESVAWVSERKDTLSGLFFALILLTYARYVWRGVSKLRYWTIVVLFAAGLLAKPILVTLPFVLLLLDYWPLQRVPGNRLRPADWWPLVIEKLPLFVLTGLSLWFVLVDPFSLNGPPRVLADPPSFLLRLQNAIVSYSVYVWQMFSPTGLSVRYPFPTGGVPAVHVVISLAFLTTVSAVAYWLRSSRPYLFVGWLWYVGMLLPVRQIVLLGSEARTDHYTYLSQIGLYLCVAWGVADILQHTRYRIQLDGVAAVAALLAMMLLAHKQTGRWRDSISLWAQAVSHPAADAITHHNYGFALATEDELSDEAVKHYQIALQLRPNYVDANNNLGLALAARGQLDDAIRHYQQALRDDPDYLYAANNIGVALARKGQLAEAARHLEEVLRRKPTYAEARDNMGLVLAAQGNLEEAVQQHQLAIAAKPHFAQAHNNLGMALARQGKAFEAMQCYRRALERKPNYGAAHLNLGMLLAAQGKLEDAVNHYQAAVKLEPRSPAAHNNLAWLLATSPVAYVRNGARAVELAQEAARLTSENDPSVLDTLAAAHAEAGEYEKAVTVTTRAIELARAAENTDLAAQLEARRQLYLRREPYRDRA